MGDHSVKMRAALAQCLHVSIVLEKDFRPQFLCIRVINIPGKLLFSWSKTTCGDFSRPGEPAGCGFLGTTDHSASCLLSSTLASQRWLSPKERPSFILLVKLP